jgi:voltage-gated potassium channel
MPSRGEQTKDAVRRQRWELLEQYADLTDVPMVALSLVWLALLVVDFTSGTGPALQAVSNLIWGVFILDFVINLVIAPDKRVYLRRNWLTIISLLLPALRVLRVFRALRVLRAARAVRSINLVRLLTSVNRGMRAVSGTFRRRGIGYVVAITLIVTLAGAAGMARFESPAALREAGLPATPGEGLNGYGEAVWWTAMIMTTLGSEYWPRTGEGRLLGWLLSVYALAVFGYITAAVASFFVGRDRTDTNSLATADEVRALRTEIAVLRRELAAARETEEEPDAARIGR